MKRLTVLLIVILAIITSPALMAKKNKGGPAGPDPTITVSTDCIPLTGKNAGNWVNKFNATGSPDMKKDLLALAIAKADQQVYGDPDPANFKDPCVVTRTTPGGTVHEVYVAEPDD